MLRSALLCPSVLTLLALIAGGGERAASPEEVWHSVEMSGKLVGYHVTSVRPGDAERGAPTVVETRLLMKLSALGQDFDTSVLTTRRLDPATGRTLGVDTAVTRGDQTHTSALALEGDEARFTSPALGEPKTLELDPDVIVDDGLAFPYLVRDLAEGGPEKKTYRTLDVTRGEIHDKTFTRVGRETLRFVGGERDCLVVEGYDRQLGLHGKLWVDRATGRLVRAESSNGIVLSLSDATVKDRIERGDLDAMIFGKVNVAIADFKSIESMRVRAKIRAIGEPVTAESLSVPGQRFTGTVTENLVDGVFEIAYARFEGKDAPAFPSDPAADEARKRYLAPEEMIESNDPVLIAKARDLTAGAKDRWDAARRLGRWVADEIGYEIPGGSARHTFDARKGECGSHSRLLAALCRAVGIPARVISGCMYTPLHGGSFGQHAWNEIHLGEAGWVPVDATAGEVDGVDSGHLRLGESAAFNPVSMEVLDYRAGGHGKDEVTAGLGRLDRVPLRAGESRTFRYLLRGTPLGTETVTLARVEETPDGPVLTGSGRIELTGRSTSCEWTLGPDGRPRAYRVKGRAGAVDYTIDCAFSEQEVVEKVVQAGTPIERTVPLPATLYLIDNNNLGLLALLASAAPREEGQTRSFSVFHPSSMRVLPAQVTVKGLETIEWAGRSVECRVLEISLAGTPLRMWLDAAGRTLRESEQNGTLVVEMVPPEAPAKGD